ncbi:MAG: insulinase family protein, partial [Bacteroidales bacterium]|nr:insulinase family protein [Bacteroidales bacterium]
RNLFPENGYHYSSGGYPAAIPSLTYEDFLAFHKKNYHPCNSYIFLYGDADLAKELEFIDKEYLSKYEKAEPPAKPNPNPAFSEIKELHSVYPVMEGMLTDHQTYLVMNWVIGSGADPTLTMALDMLADVLVNQESAPVRKAMLEAGIGKDIYATNQAMLQNVFSIVVQNANAADKDKFRAVIDSTLRQVFSAKLDKEILEGAINRMEFRLREGNDAQKGLTYNMRSLAGWIYTDNPFAALEYEKPLATLKTALTSTYLEDLMKKELVDNRYGLVLIHEPKPGLEKELTEKTRNDLAAIKKNLSPAEMDSIIARTTELIAHQQRKDSPEAIASIPMLKLADINSEAMWYEPTEQKVADIPHLHFDDFTNRIVYMNYWFDLRVLTEEQLPYASLLTRLLGKMDAGNYTYEQLDKALNINTGGFGTSVAAFLPQRDDNQLTPRLRVTLKTTVEKLDTAFSLLDVIINHTMLDNKDRLYELLRRHQSQLESNVNQNGFGVAVNRLESYYSRRGVFTEKTRGLDYYWFVTNLTNAFNDNPGKVIDDLKQVYEALFSADNMIAGITCEDGDFKTYAGKFEAFASSLGHKDIALKTWELKPAALNEGILSTSKVQYVLQGYDMNKLDIGWNGKWYVLNQVVSTDWLQNQVRVIGGAYGGFATFSYTGSCYFASYRDPNLSETLNNFKGTVAYLKDFKADSTTMTRYIIGTIANLDNPLTPSEKGETAFRRYFEKTTREDIQRERDEVLATSDADIRSMSDEIDKILEQQVVCVYGNEQKINANKTLFKELVKLQ